MKHKEPWWFYLNRRSRKLCNKKGAGKCDCVVGADPDKGRKFINAQEQKTC